MAYLSAVELEGIEAHDFGSGEAVRARWRTSQPFFKEVNDGLGPRGGVVAAGTAWGPKVFFFLSASFGESSGQNIEPAAGDAQLMGGFSGAEGLLVEGF